MPNNVETLKILGSLYAHVQISDPTLLNEARQKGRDILQKYLKIVPGDIEVLIDLAQLLEHCEPKKSLEMYEMAIELLETMENIGPQPEMLNNVGALHMQMGDYQKAKQCFEQARNRLTEMIETQERDEAERPQLLTIRYNLARCLEYLCESLEAEQMYKEILHECPNYTDCYMRLGCLTRDRGQIYESSVWFKNALQYDQASADAWTLIGNLHMSKNEWQPAQKKFEHILTKAGPKTSDAYSLIALGNVWLEQLMNPGRKKEDEKKYMDRALQMYQKALKIQPKNMLAANGIGCVLAFKKAFMDARDVFSQVREATSEYFDVWINIAHVYMEKEQYMAAVQMYFSAMKKFKHENDPNILHYLAKAYYKAGMLTESKEQLEKALLEANDNVQIKFNYAVVLKRSAKNIFKSVTKITSEMVKNAMDNLKCSERIFVFISKNEDLSLPGAKLLSRTICREEAQNCRDLLAQAKVKLETALMNDEDDRKLKEKQEKEKEELRKKYAEEIARKEEEERKKIEAAKALRSTFVEMTKDILKLPEVVEDKKRTGGGRGRRKGGDDGDEFVNDSSDNGNWKSGDEEGGENRERRKKDKKSRKRREKDGGGSDNDRKQDRKKKRKEDRERKMQEKLSAKQSAKIKSRAFLSSSESSDDDDKKGGNLDEDSDNEAPRNRVDEFESPPPPIIGSSDSDSSDEEEKKTKKKRRKTVMDSDNSSAGSENEEEGDAPIIGASDDDDDEGPSNKKSSDEDVPSKRKKKKMLSSGESDSDESD
ncbi:unnamed protein product [Caenorhabditis angaria]|uniref:Uncharacterized protein n=1 Tax=Caenorhabditis angaria TaxID=860376 RepID=A0A9P1II49_9PELO|nr:unnamed protein product [Caenorhabditis angaria]